MTEQAEQARPISSGSVPVWWPYLVMVVGLFAVSTAAIIIRLAQAANAPSLVISAGRLCVASVVLTPIVAIRHRDELKRIRPRDMMWAMVSGLVLGLHFASWITSLEYTAVVNSVTLVTTNSLWVALMAPVFLNEKLDRAAVIGVAVATVGGILVGISGESGDPPTRNAPWLGNGLALLGAVAASIYFVIGRSLRARLSVLVYIWLVYSAAAVVLVIAVIVTGQMVAGFSAQTYLWIILLGLVPQLIGHSSFNYALGFFSAAYVSLIVLVEPVATGFLAMVFLDEWPVPLQLLGATIILIGIGVSSRENRLVEAAPVTE